MGRDDVTIDMESDRVEDAIIQKTPWDKLNPNGEVILEHKRSFLAITEWSEANNTFFSPNECSCLEFPRHGFYSLVLRFEGECP